MDAQVAAMKQARQLRNSSAIQIHPHVKLVLAVRAGLQQTARGEFAETSRCLVGTGGRTGKTDYHLAIFGRINIHVGVADVEDGFCVAELEINPAAADLNVGYA